MQILEALKERFTEREQERAQSAQTTYRQLVERLADGEEPALDEVEDALQSGERTIGQLTADVELLQQRRKWSQTLADRDDANAELQRLRSSRQAEVDHFAQLQKEHHERLQELGNEEAPVQVRLKHAHAAENELIRTCNETDLLTREAELHELRSKKSPRRQFIKRDLWGYSQVGKFTDVETASTGQKYVTLIEKLQRTETLYAHNQTSFGSLEKARQAMEGFERREVQPMTEEYHRLTRELAEIETDLESLQREKLTP